MYVCTSCCSRNEQETFSSLIAKQNKIEVFRGSEADLVDRYYQAIKETSAKNVLRLPADNPIPDPKEYDRIINYHLNSDNDFSSNICNFIEQSSQNYLRIP